VRIPTFEGTFDFFRDFYVARAADGNKATQGNRPHQQRSYLFFENSHDERVICSLISSSCWLKLCQTMMFPKK
jgi:hypothetical protein